MEPIIRAYVESPDAMEISPLSIRRDWMDATPDKHAYHCFPVTLANTVGWAISSKIDIKLIWNGVNDTTAETVKVLEGGSAGYTGRGQSSFSFSTGFRLKTSEDISILTMNCPNYFYEDFEVISSVISTSFYRDPLPLAIKIKTPNKEITIKAGTPIAAIIPISLGALQNSYIEVSKHRPSDTEQQARMSYGSASAAMTQTGEWTDWYRNAVNEKNESIGKHEVKNLKLDVTYLGEDYK